MLTTTSTVRIVTRTTIADTPRESPPRHLALPPPMSDPSVTARRGTPLTPAELRALEMREQVDTDAEAALLLGCSVHTLRAHLRNARSRLGVRSTQRAIRKAGV
jgi:DNA-binding CsgD family transcriptional regulator